VEGLGSADRRIGAGAARSSVRLYTELRTLLRLPTALAPAPFATPKPTKTKPGVLLPKHTREVHPD